MSALGLANHSCICQVNKCGYRFDHVPLSIPVIGEQPEERAVKVLQKMHEHITKKHLDHWTAIMMGAQRAFAPFMVATSFAMSDPNAAHHAKILRAQILLAIGRPFIPDEHIQGKIAELNGTLTPENVFRLMCQMRDILAEVPSQNPPSPIIHP